MPPLLPRSLPPPPCLLAFHWSSRTPLPPEARCRRRHPGGWRRGLRAASNAAADRPRPRLASARNAQGRQGGSGGAGGRPVRARRRGHVAHGALNRSMVAGHCNLRHRPPTSSASNSLSYLHGPRPCRARAQRSNRVRARRQPKEGLRWRRASGERVGEFDDLLRGCAGEARKLRRRRTWLASSTGEPGGGRELQGRR